MDIYLKSIRFASILLIVITIRTFTFERQNLCAVLDLTSDGSIPKKSRSLISDNISKAVIVEGGYILFDRKVLPELLTQLSIYESTDDCDNQQCLVMTGSLIGADVIIGGMVRYKNKLTEITLNMVDVAERQTIHSVSMSSGSKKKVFLNEEIPALVKNLLNSEIPSQPNIVHRKHSILKNPLLYAGTILAGGAAAGVYYFKFYKKNDAIQSIKEEETKEVEDVEEVVETIEEIQEIQEVENEVTLPLSMDDVPQRTRGGD